MENTGGKIYSGKTDSRQKGRSACVWGEQDKIDIRKRVAFINLKANEKSITIDLPGRDGEGP